MAVSLTGAQFKAWLASNWGPDAMWEEEHYTVDGAEVLDDTNDYDTDQIPDAAKVVLTAGTIYMNQMEQDGPTVDAVRHARAWLKALKTVSLVVEVPRDQEANVRAILAAISKVRVHAI